MANLKKGLDFFYLKIIFYDDIKIRKLIRYHGAQAVVVYQLILIRIFTEGYYLNWDDDLAFVISETSHLEDDYVNKVIKYCIEIGLFDKTLFEQSKVMTSADIQNQFFDFCVVSKRRIPAENPYLLIDLSQKAVRLSKIRNNSEKRGDSSEQSLVFTEESPSDNTIFPNNSEKRGDSSEFKLQSRVEKSRVDNNTPLTPLGGNGDDNPVDDFGVVLEDNRGDSGLNESREKDSNENHTVVEVKEAAENDNPKGYEKFDLSYIEEPFREAFFSWLEYKRADQSFKYKSDRSIKTCYNKLVELSGNNPHKAMLLVEQSIANGWKGFFLSTVSHGTEKQQLTAQQRIDAEIQRGIEHFNSIDVTGGKDVHSALQPKVW